MEIDKIYFDNEVRDGFLVPTIVKRAWAAQIKVLSELDRICDENNLNYWVSYGTLLGAVRHKGFIPWDDDIDVSMPRRDYMKLKSLFENNNDYVIEFFETELDECKGGTVTRVLNKKKYSFSKEELEDYYGFPYTAGVDIFPVDNLPDSQKERDILFNKTKALISVIYLIFDGMANEIETNNLINDIENLFDCKINRTENVISQMWKILYNLFDSYNGCKTQEVAHMLSWYRDNQKTRFLRDDISSFIKLPFEYTYVKAPKGYDNILKKEYGDYMIVQMDTSDHEYPFFNLQSENLKESKYSFEKCLFDEKYIARKICKEDNYKEGVLEKITLLCKMNNKLIDLLSKGQIDDVLLDILDKMQEISIKAGEALELNLLAEDCDACISLLENYCEKIYNLYSVLTGQNDMDIIELLETMNDCVNHIREETLKIPKFGTKKKVLFVVSRAKYWNVFKNLYRELNVSQDVNVTVMCAPVAYRSFSGELEEFVSEAEFLPEDVLVTDYESFDFGHSLFDVVVTCDGYENQNLEETTMTFFYPSSLQQYAKKVVFVSPYNIDDNFTSLTQSPGRVMDYYVKMPGVAAADVIIVKSNNLRSLYIDALAQWSGESTRDMWNTRVVSAEMGDIKNTILE